MEESKLDNVLPCPPASPRRSWISGSMSVKLVTDDCTEAAHQAPATVNATGENKTEDKKEIGGVSECDTPPITNSPKPKSIRKLRKRVRTRESDETSKVVSSGEEAVTPKRAMPRKGRGRGRGRGQPYYTGSLENLKATYMSTEPSQEDLVERETEIIELSKRAAKRRELRLALPTADSQTAIALKQQAIDGVNVVLKVAARSGNLKSSFQGALQDAAIAISEATEGLGNKSISEETRQLQEDVTRLKAENELLRRELSDLKKMIGPSTTANMESSGPDPKKSSLLSQDAIDQVMQCVNTLMNAHLEAIESKFRSEKQKCPSVAGIRSSERSVATKAVNNAEPNILSSRDATTTTLVAPTDSVQGSIASKSSKKGKKGKKSKPKKTEQSEKIKEAGKVSEQQNTERGWTEVGKRGVKKRMTTGTAINHQKRDSKKPQTANLRAPVSAAVVVTLQPEAEERGVTYMSVLTEARKKVDLKEIGITNLKMRKAATGARIFEVYGDGGREKADKLAAKLTHTIGADVFVSRPVKCAELRISGLDDSVTVDEVANTIARDGNCPSESVKVGDIRVGFDGLGTVWVRCPILAAKALAEGKTLRVGWSSANVTLLQTRRMRCFRCLEVGHAQTQCTSDIDRSGACYRCGESGHKSRYCSAPPHCLICAAAKKPSNHILGNRLCFLSSTRGKQNMTNTKSTSRLTAQQTNEQVIAMSN